MNMSPQVQTLCEAHLADLRKSGLSDETIAASGFYSESDDKKLSAILNSKYSKRLGPALVITFPDPDGAVSYRRVKPSLPRTWRGKLVKYESPKGMKNRAYIPPSVLGQLLELAELVLTEGEKKALKATQEGFPTIGLIGVWGWKDGKGADRLIPDLEFDWRGKRVFIAFDSDLADNDNLLLAESALAQQLINRGAIVKVVRIPPGPNGEKVGLDDYLVAHTRVEFRKLLDSAEDPDKPAVPSKTPAKLLDPTDEARKFIDEYCRTDAGELTLRWQHEQFYGWNYRSYVEFPKCEIEARIWQHVDEFAHHINSAIVGNISRALESLTMVSSAKLMPCWLDAPADFPPDELLPTNSGLLHLPSLIAGKPSLMPSTPRFFSLSTLDYAFDADATCPGWLTFLDSVWPNDPQSIETLQMMFGYLLLPDTRQHKLFMLLGPKRSGKGTIGRIIKALVGAGNLASPTLASLSGPFGMWPLLGRTVALIADARLSGRSDAVSIVERLLSISGDDPQDVHRKNLPTISGIRLPVRFVIMSNELPSMRDASGAFASRVILLRMDRSFYGKEDKKLTERLLGEISGILNWAIRGWQLLQQRGGFEQPESAKELLDDLAELSSPISHFIADRCVTGPQYSCILDRLFAAWKAWCEQHGRDHIGTTVTFSKDLRAALSELKVSRPRGGEGERRITTYNGIDVAPG